MRQSAAPPAPEPVILGLAVIAVLALYRGGMLWVSTADLFMDESQYWLWGQALDWGYYSKPPMIGWVLRAFTELAGSDAIPIIRLPMVLFQTATAIIVLFAARQITDPVSATWCGVVYATCPFTAAGSFLVSTDTVLAPFFAMMLLLYLRLARRSSAMLALTLGFCMGLGMLAKYAAVYFVIGAVIGALLIPPARISPRDLALAAASLGITVAPNVLWNLQNDLTTLSHTVDNVDWIKDIGSDMSLNWAGPGAFLAGQFLVFGPIWFAAYPWAIWRALRGSDWRVKWLVCMSLPIIVLVCGQALLSKAYANWAVMAYLAALLLTVPFLWLQARALFYVGLVLNICVSLFVPVAFTQATAWTFGEGDRLVLRRFVGRAEMSQRLMARARAEGVETILASDRNILADLLYQAGDADLTIKTIPHDGRPAHYYARAHAFTGSDRPVLLVVMSDTPPDCVDGSPPRLLDIWTPPAGAYERSRIHLFIASGRCWPDQ